MAWFSDQVRGQETHVSGCSPGRLRLLRGMKKKRARFINNPRIPDRCARQMGETLHEQPRAKSTPAEYVCGWSNSPGTSARACSINCLSVCDGSKVQRLFVRASTAHPQGCGRPFGKLSLKRFSAALPNQGPIEAPSVCRQWQLPSCCKPRVLLRPSRSPPPRRYPHGAATCTTRSRRSSSS